MKDFDLEKLLQIHEFSSYVVPGAILMYFLDFFYPQPPNFISDNISIGSLIIFLLLSYAAGHIIQSLGSRIEVWLIEPVFGDQKKQLQKKLKKDIDKLYLSIQKNNNNKIKTFKSHAKIRRGIATCFLILLSLGWTIGFLNKTNLYLTINSTIIILLSFIYMRDAEKRELEELLKVSAKIK